MITNQWRDSNLLAVDICSKLRACFDIHQESPRQQTSALLLSAILKRAELKQFFKTQNYLLI
jgi:hypothetical protein